MKIIIQILCIVWIISATVMYNVSGEHIQPVRETISIILLIVFLIITFGSKNK